MMKGVLLLAVVVCHLHFSSSSECEDNCPDACRFMNKICVPVITCPAQKKFCRNVCSKVCEGIDKVKDKLANVFPKLKSEKKTGGEFLFGKTENKGTGGGFLFGGNKGKNKKPSLKIGGFLFGGGAKEGAAPAAAKPTPQPEFQQPPPVENDEIFYAGRDTSAESMQNRFLLAGR